MNLYIEKMVNLLQNNQVLFMLGDQDHMILIMACNFSQNLTTSSKAMAQYEPVESYKKGYIRFLKKFLL